MTTPSMTERGSRVREGRPPYPGALPLENGDRLDRAEFERRYRAMPGVKKAELIEGVVYMPSPVQFDHHARPHARMVGWLLQYEDATPGTQVCDNATLRLDPENEVQPDALLRIVSGGASRATDDGYLAGAPELVVEIASSSASYDLHDKREAYRRNGVAEYLVWLTREERFLWWHLEEGTYRQIEAVEGGVLRSVVFPGLWLDAAAMLSGDYAKARETLEAGLRSAEHGAFP